MSYWRNILAAASMMAMAILPGHAFADKVDDAIVKAAQAHKKGDLATAMQELQYAVTKINEKLSRAYKMTFPPPPEGWRAGRVRSSTGIAMIRVQGQIMNRRYTQQGGRGRMNAQLIVDSPTMQAYLTLFSNPAYARQAGYDRVKLEGVPEPAMMKFDEDRKRGDIILVTAGRILIKVTGRRLESGDVLIALTKAWKIAQVRKIAGIK
jgi:hypothetical protein